MFYTILFFTTVGFITVLFGLAYLSLKVEEYLLYRKFDFESRLQKGEILHKGNIFNG